MKRTGPTNIYLRKLISDLKKKSVRENNRIWRYVAKLLSRPSRNRVEVNLWKINKYAKDGDIVIVPGKVLGTGNVNKDITIIAWRYSKSVEEILKNKNIKYLKLSEIVDRQIDLSKVKIII